MDRIVLDSNCLLQLVGIKAEHKHIWEKIRNGTIKICVTTEILNEYREVLNYWYSDEFAESIMQVIVRLKGLEQINIYYKWLLITNDPDDNKFVDCAVSANALYLVTNDKHFNILKTIDFPKVDTITLVEYSKLV